MTSVTKCFEFDAAHRLMNHRGKCSNIHGHRYRVEVEISAVGKLDPRSGVVIDFDDLTKVVGSWIDEHFDHGFLVERSDVVVRDFLQLNGFKRYIFEGPPTAENVARELVGIVSQSFEDYIVTSLKVWETPSCCATVQSCDETF